MQEEMQPLGEQILRVVVFPTTLSYRMGETAHIFTQKNVFHQETETSIMPKNMNGMCGNSPAHRDVEGWQGADIK